MKSNPKISFKDVALSYGKSTIIKDASFDIFSGQFVVISGESGSGKSTLLYSLGGFLSPLLGTIFFEGKSLYALGGFGLGRYRKKNIGYLFQDFRLLPNLTVEQNVKFPFFFTGKKVLQSELNEIMKSLGIYHIRKSKPRNISGGEAQRTSLARAMFLKPNTLLLDEPTGNLDSVTELEILSILKSLIEKGITIICVTHSKVIIKAAERIFHVSDSILNEKKRKKSSLKIISSKKNNKSKIEKNQFQ